MRLRREAVMEARGLARLPGPHLDITAGRLPQARHPAHHVRPTQVNWRPAAPSRYPAVGHESHCSQIPHLCLQRLGAQVPQRRTRRTAHRFQPDPTRERRRSASEASTGLQCCGGLPYLVCHDMGKGQEHEWLTADRNFSPIPKRVMDGSEPGDSVAAAVLSGAPIDLQARTVRYGWPSDDKKTYR